MSLKEKQMLMQLLTELVRAWSSHHSIEDIYDDQDKVLLLLSVHESLSSEVVAPVEVRNYYAEVFRRPIWG